MSTIPTMPPIRYRSRIDRTQVPSGANGTTAGSSTPS